MSLIPCLVVSCNVVKKAVSYPVPEQGSFVDRVEVTCQSKGVWGSS